MGPFAINAWRVFVLLLGIWTGSGIHDSVAGHFAWYANPLGWAERPSVPGMVNPWPFSTLLLLLATIVAAFAVWRHRGSGRREAMIAIIGTALILVATLGWFVPELGRMFADDSTYTPGQVVAHSRTWIILNAVRIAASVVLFWYALISLGRIETVAKQ
jgi:uncharacterized membrane protein